MTRKRRSQHLSRLRNELRKHALQVGDEELRSKLWSYYYKTERAENEIREMVMDAEMRRLLDFVFPNGIPSDLVNDKPHTIADDDDSPPPDDNMPKQRGLWD